MSWETEQNCLCYTFLIVDGEKVVTQKIDHAYSVKIRLKGKADLMEFRKTIKMNTEVSHKLEDWAAVSSGGSDSEASGYNTPDFSQFIPWAYAYGFHGNVASSSLGIVNNGELLTTSVQHSGWIGSLHETAETLQGNIDFLNISLPAYHLAYNRCNATADSVSSYPVGWAEVAVGESGWQLRWVDDVGFVDHEVISVSTPSTITSLRELTFTDSGQTVNAASKYNVTGSVVPYAGDMRHPATQKTWEPIYPLLDPFSDGWHLGWSHWMMESIVPSRWTWIRDLVDMVIRDRNNLPTWEIVTRYPLNGNYRGSITVSRTLTDADGNPFRIILASDNSATRIFRFQAGSLIELPLPDKMTDLPGYPVCPI